MSRIPDILYQEIIENVPICCVDIVVLHKGKVLLTLRKNEPEKGKWFYQGGRLLKNEKVEDAVKRKAKEEIGIDVKVIKKIGTYEYFCKEYSSYKLATGFHAICITFLVEPIIKEALKIILDKTLSDYRWTDHIGADFDPYLRTVLEDAKVFTK